ncbi:MAG TPA: hypothetical protein VGK78_15120 [Nocardioides sp.]|uniref:hypothetical protein n=1 Tax=Nocardioides sp. TaxID=35761 RepID=UPI002F3FCBEB
MPTALSWTDPGTTAYAKPGHVAAAHRAVADVAILFRFRKQAVRRRHLARALSLIFLAITLGAASIPAFTPGAHATHGKSVDVLVLVPSAMAAILVLNMASAIASGGGRELISRDQAASYPISPTTDHLGALLLAPLNIAWMIQAWVLLGMVAYATPLRLLVQTQLTIVLWLVFSTASGQVVAWTMEAIRRGPFGIAISRGLLVILGLLAAAVQLTGNAGNFFDQVPTLWLFLHALAGWSWRWAYGIGLLLAASLVAVALGAMPAHLAARRMPRDEARMETDQHEPRPMPSTVLGILVRTDRASVWRSVPMRRGVLVLAVGPGLVALFGDLHWAQMTILPGLVASGGALLFGVNAWCLDGRGALWRENLPAPATALFDARTLILAEFLGVASLITVLVGALRAGLPNAEELAALLATLVVVTLQVVGAALRWSLKHPYPVDLRSARATPAPPAAMVGYSARLATCTTFTGLVFSGCAHVPDWRLSVIVAIPCMLWSATRLARTRRRWEDPLTRALVVSTVAA